MTTLFPQIKRVDEDETSKIIKNVLMINNQEHKLDKIFDDVLHLTRDLPYSDVDCDEDSEDDEEEEDDDDDEDDDEDGDEDQEEDEDDDEDGDEDEEEEEEDEEDEDEEEPRESTPPREPTSWNLDQFIPAKPKQEPTPTRTQAQPHQKLQTQQQQHKSHQPKQHKQQQLQHQEQLKQEQVKQEQLKQEQLKQEQLKQEQLRQEQLRQEQLRQEQLKQEQLKQEQLRLEQLKQEQIKQEQIKQEQQHQKQQHQKQEQQKQLQLQQQQQQQEKLKQHHQIKQETHELQQQQQLQLQRDDESKQITSDKDSCIVQIDLSKLKRVPKTKAPTPNVTGTNSMTTAKALKHEADAEKDKTKQAIKYLESSMYFVLHGQEMEATTNDTKYYNSVIPLLKHVLRMSAPNSLENLDNMTNLKIHALAQRCLSLLHMRMYKARERELPELAKTIGSLQDSSPIQQADEVLIGIKPRVLAAYKRQLAIYVYLKQAHDHWHNVEHLCDQHPALRIFFSTIESNCGPLTMVSLFPKLMDHVQCGLKLLRTS